MENVLLDNEVVLIAAGGHGAELHSYFADLKVAGLQGRLLGVLDDSKPAGPWLDSQILGPLESLPRLLASRAGRPLGYLTAVGSNELRRKLVARIEVIGGKAVFPWTLRHPHAQVGQRAEIGPGSCLAPGAIVTTRVRIGKHCILNLKASVSHDCTVGDFANLNPNATICGACRIGEGCFIGAGATVINGVSIGDWTIVGAGAVVVRDLPAHVTAVGVPARIIKHHEAALQGHA
jgi:sugar O-acyltransferase (sialic acid O-acetyltransferase NeuD family)